MQDGLELSHSETEAGSFVTLYPEQDSGWALLSTAGAFSTLHIDAGGYCMVVNCRIGSKIWGVAREDITDPGTFTSKGFKGNLTVDLTRLEKGDDLYVFL